MNLKRRVIVIFAGVAAAFALLIVQSQKESDREDNSVNLDDRQVEEADTRASSNSLEYDARASQLNTEITDVVAAIDRNEIRFGELEPLRIQLIPFRGKMPTAPVVVKDSYDSLVAQVRSGNVGAGYTLYASLSGCSDGFLDEESLVDGINRLYATRRIRSPSGAERAVPDDVNVQDIETSFRNSFARCNGLSKEQVTDEPMLWLEQSATMGFLPAVDRLAWTLHEGGDSSDSNAVRFFEEAWELGSTSTLTGLYEVFIQGSDSLPADSVKATAYLYLHNALFNGMYANHKAGGVISRQIERSEAKLAEALASLNPEQAGRIPQIARDMLAENKNCCIDWGR